MRATEGREGFVLTALHMVTFLLLNAGRFGMQREVAVES